MSILPGFEYDLFISYRQNDNRSGWVTDFVKSLQEELAATIKEPVSVYFDTNPHDGLLETHNVDKTLEGKLKCLIFIPIISQTYCDTKSFAWQQEFCVFNAQSKSDQFGREVKLATGNVASRILPVKIHSLDAVDQKALETEKGSFLRAVEFVYKESGVNRPLSPDDDPSENLNRTKYRNQVNKVANAVKEIMVGLQNFGDPEFHAQSPEPSAEETKWPPGKSIVVLPFEDMSPEKDQEYFCDGLAEELISALTKIKDVQVVARTSAFSFKRKEHDVRKIGKKLKVESLLEGSVRKAGNQLRIMVQLINVADGFPIWSQRYDRKVEDVFAIQDEIALNIVEKLKINLAVGERKLIMKRRTENTEVYELYLKGNHYLWLVTPESINKAIEYFEGAVAQDAQFALAYAGLAMCYNGAAWFEYLDPQESFSKARGFATTALQIDDTLAEAYACLAYNNCLDWNGSLAEQQYKRAIEFKPSYADAHLYYAWYLGGQGRIDEAMTEMKSAQQLDPLSLIINANLSFPYYWNRQYGQAIKQSLSAFQLDPTFYLTHWFLGIANAQAGNYQDAISAFEKSVKFSGGGPYYKAWLGHASALAGNKQEAQRILQELLQLSTPEKSFSYQIAIVCIGLGDTKEAMNWLEKAYAERAPLLWYLKIDPYLDPLRSNPRFREMLIGMGLVNDKPAGSTPLPSGTGTKEKSIVVLPFENMSADKDNEYFSDGLTEEIIADLSNVNELSVISRGSAMTFKGTKKKTKAIADEVNVRYVLEGSVRKEGNNLRITAQLIDGTTDVHVWSEKYSGTMDHVFEIQEKLSRSIVSALRVHISPREDKKLGQHPISDVQAYECFIRARQELMKLTEQGLNNAIIQLERGLRLTERNATLHATLATTYLYFHHFGIKVTDEMLVKASEHSALSLELDPECAQAYVVRAIVLFKGGRMQEAVRTFKKGLMLDPGNTDALFWLSVCYCISGKADFARPYTEKLLQVDPLTLISQAVPGWIEYYAGNLPAAIPLYERWLNLDPDGPFTRWCCVAAYSYTDLDRCFTVLDTIIRDMPQLVFGKLALFYKNALHRNKTEALLYATKELKEEAVKIDYLRVQMAMGFALIGEKEEAVWWLRKAFEGGYTNYPLLEKDPFLKNLEVYPAFENLMAEMKERWEKFEV